jgi:acyl-CoA thioester hydrolase
MPKIFTTDINVRFYECDFYQHVNNANYVNYLDVAIADLFKKLYSEELELDYVFHMVHASLDFINPATFNDNLEITTFISAIGNTSATFTQSIKNKTTGIAIVNAKKIVVFLTKDATQKIPVPEKLKSLI